MGMFSSLGTLAGGVAGGFFGGPAGAAVGAGLGSYIGGSADNRQAWKYSKKQADYQNAQQLAFWNLNNDYNSPTSVMQRLEEAGLNPNLVYQNGGSSYQATMPTAGKLNFNYNHDVDPLVFQQLSNMEAQNELLKSQSSNLFWQAGLNQNNASIANSNANIARWREDYARREHEVFKRTGRIPESYLKSNPIGELTGFIRDGLTNLLFQ